MNNNKNEKNKKSLIISSIILIAIIIILSGVAIYFLTNNKDQDDKTLAYTDLIKEISYGNIEKIEITNGKISSGVLIVTDIIPEGKNAFAFIITSSTNVQAHTAQIWKNLNNGSVNVSFKLWSDAAPALVMNGTVSGILLCI